MLASDGQEGWKKNSSGWWYVNSDGTYPKNKWQKINGVYYFFDQNGYMKSNAWHKHSDGHWYYLLPNGAMATGWILVSNKWYYFDKDGAMKTGWVKYKDVWYFLDYQQGAMVSNAFVKSADGKGWYYLKSDGSLAEKLEFTVEPNGLITTK